MDALKGLDDYAAYFHEGSPFFTIREEGAVIHPDFKCKAGELYFALMDPSGLEYIIGHWRVPNNPDVKWPIATASFRPRAGDGCEVCTFHMP